MIDLLSLNIDEAAGDAFLAGMIAGITAGLEPPGAQKLATLVAALSVTSPHTIHKGIDREEPCRFCGPSKDAALTPRSRASRVSTR